MDGPYHGIDMDGPPEATDSVCVVESFSLASSDNDDGNEAERKPPSSPSLGNGDGMPGYIPEYTDTVSVNAFGRGVRETSGVHETSSDDEDTVCVILQHDEVHGQCFQLCSLPPQVLGVTGW